MIVHKAFQILALALFVASRAELVGRERFELSTFRLSAERSSQAELPAQWFKLQK